MGQGQTLASGTITGNTLLHFHPFVEMKTAVERIYFAGDGCHQFLCMAAVAVGAEADAFVPIALYHFYPCALVGEHCPALPHHRGRFQQGVLPHGQPRHDAFGHERVLIMQL